MDQPFLSALRALVDLHRLRIVARLATGPADVVVLAADMRQPVPAVRRQLDVLLLAGLVEPVARRGDEDAIGGLQLFAVRPDRIGELGRALATLDREAAGSSPPGSDGAWPHDGESFADTLARLEATPDEVRILRSYLVDGRLATIPVHGRKRLVVLRFLLERVFTEDRPYPEKEVNQRLALFHPDVAALRRYLVDERFVDREAGVYRRR
jgi:DNA-binding transcriptional ArsR family regulator